MTNVMAFVIKIKTRYTKLMIHGDYINIKIIFTYFGFKRRKQKRFIRLC